MVYPYITFSGECRQALDFYQTVFHSKVSMQLPYGDYVPEGVTAPPANLSEWVLHAEMDLCGTKFWFADEIAHPVSKDSMIKLTATVPDATEARRIYDALCDGATVTLPPTQTFYSTFHAGLVDQFGVGWNITAEESPNQH